VLVHHDTNRYDLTVKTSHGSAVIHTTSNHLFWDLTRSRWIKAGVLRYGDHLRTPNGVNLTAVGGHTPANAAGWMWDLSVPGGGDHDFYIATSAVPVLVHNCPVDPGAPEQGSASVPAEGSISSPSKLDRIFPGPYARAGIALEDGNINDPFVREFINEAGSEYGCHTCGAMEPGTLKGNWVVDELPPKALVVRGTPQTAWPQCIDCMHGQAGVVSVIAREVMENKW
jgi:hypothetical protein